MRKKKNYQDVSFGEFFSDAATPGKPLSDKEHKYLDKRRFKIVTFTKLLLVTFVAFSVVIFSNVLGIGVMASYVAPTAFKIWDDFPSNIGDVAIGSNNIIFDAKGNKIAEIYSQNRKILPSINDVSPFAREALVDTEDKEFYTQGAVNYAGITRAAVTRRGGGSGITQQLVKNLLFYNLAADKKSREEAVSHNYARKLKEIKLAYAYEKDHSKDEILLNYLNLVAFGEPNTYGIETASERFFGKSAKDLTLAEASALVGTVNNPVIYSFNNPKKLWKDRQKVVLDSMLRQKSITKQQYDEAWNTELALQNNIDRSGTCASSAYPFYCEYVLDYIRSSPRYGKTQQDRERLLSVGGLRIYTPLNTEMDNKLKAHVDADFGVTNRIVAPTVVVQPGTGYVLAGAVNRNYGTNPGETVLNPINIPTATGSVFKMMTLAAAAVDGYTDKQLQFKSYNCPLRIPGYQNPPGGFRNSVSCAFQGGFLNYKQATAYSSNTWFITLAYKIGLPKVMKFAKSVGLNNLNGVGDTSLAYVLGPTEEKPVDVAAAYATFVNKGVFCPATPIKNVTFADGQKIPIPEGYNPKIDSCKRVMTPAQASLVLRGMHADVDTEIPNAMGIDAIIDGYPSGGKSGTNELYNSAWIQLVPQYSLYINVHDMDKLTRGIRTVYYKGRATKWQDNVAKLSGSNALREILKGQNSIPLDLHNKETKWINVPVSTKDYVIVPSVIGMKPAEAIKTMQDSGIQAKIMKKGTGKKPNDLFPTGVIGEQSIKPGELIPMDSQKDFIELKIIE